MNLGGHAQHNGPSCLCPGTEFLPPFTGSSLSLKSCREGHADTEAPAGGLEAAPRKNGSVSLLDGPRAAGAKKGGRDPETSPGSHHHSPRARCSVTPQRWGGAPRLQAAAAPALGRRVTGNRPADKTGCFTTPLDSWAAMVIDDQIAPSGQTKTRATSTSRGHPGSVTQEKTSSAHSSGCR